MSSTARASGPCSSASSPDRRSRPSGRRAVRRGRFRPLPRRSRSQRGRRRARARYPRVVDRQRRSGRTATPSGAGRDRHERRERVDEVGGDGGGRGERRSRAPCGPWPLRARNAIAPNASPSAPAVSDAASRCAEGTPMSKTVHTDPECEPEDERQRGHLGGDRGELREGDAARASPAARAGGRAFRAPPRPRSPRRRSRPPQSRRGAAP